MKRQPSIRVHIEELVLHGFPASDRYRIAETVSSELQRLVVEGGLPEHVPGGDVIRAGSVDVKPATVGTQIAAAIYQGLSRE